MDPDANLAEQRSLIASILHLNDLDPTNDRCRQIARLGARLAELQQALDGWISERGFLPRAWRQS
jgi:hypothetical protein